MKRSGKIIFSYFALQIAAIAYLSCMLCGLLDNDLRVIFFDVGQGDSALIRLPDRRSILIDGGVDNTVIYRLGKYLPYFDRQIDLVILTHSDADHLNGLVEVCRRYRVKAVMFSPVDSSEPAYGALVEEIKKQNVRRIDPHDFGAIEIDGKTGLEILNPKYDIPCGNVNDCSIVARLNFREIAWLFTGDISSKQEEALIGHYSGLAAAILKVAHHGSRYSTDSRFIEAVSPEVAVISVGKNNFKHPGAELLERLSQAGVKTLTTIANGDIIITSDGAKYRLSY